MDRERVRVEESDSNFSRGLSREYCPLLEVLGMKEKEGERDYQFLVRYKHDIEGIYELDHWTLFMEYPRELCLFYEKNITINDKSI